MASSKPKTIGYNSDLVVDAPFILSREITLAKIPRSGTIEVSLNGLLLNIDCYSVALNVLTLDAGLDIEVGDNMLVRYLS